MLAILLNNQEDPFKSDLDIKAQVFDRRKRSRLNVMPSSEPERPVRTLRSHASGCLFPKSTDKAHYIRRSDISVIPLQDGTPGG